MGESSKGSGSSLVNIELPEFAENAAKNLTDKPTLSIGQTIADLWQLVLGGRVSYAVEKQKIKYAYALEEYKRTLEGDISAIPDEKQIEPPLQIVGQALEDSQYCIESKDLREMFSRLIANSMNADFTEKVHPSFSKIIQQMGPLDAQMLQIFKALSPGDGIAIVNYIRRNKDDSYRTITEYVPARMPDGCSDERAASSISSLIRLGLIQIAGDSYFTHEARYAPLFGSPLYAKLHQLSEREGFTLDMQKRIARLTPLGADFVSVCLD